MSSANPSAVKPSPFLPIPVNTVSLEKLKQKGLAKIEVYQQMQSAADFTGFDVSLTRMIGEMQKLAANDSAGGKAFAWLSMRVKLLSGHGEGRLLAGVVLKNLCNSSIDWNTLEVIMPEDDPLGMYIPSEIIAMNDMSQNKDGVRDIVSERFANTRLMYKGSKYNVPWPWLFFSEMARFRIRSLELNGHIPFNYFRALVEKADMDGTAIGLELHINGVVEDDTTSDGAVTEGPVTSRIQSLNLVGWIKGANTLKSLLFAGQMFRSIAKLEAKVMETAGPMDLYDALRLCEKLERAKIECGMNQLAGVKRACEEKKLVYEPSGKAGSRYVTVTAWKNKV
ncbi:hypothetical protein K525DRAFT_275088 [Schizophyllum commune Loenen D]|nr:hypothetical protein K525DRAFT_275088 [Schizophyllum commune Loenen D]